jgi:D-sedoheptulose 7-phosphate isomerase
MTSESAELDVVINGYFDEHHRLIRESLETLHRPLSAVSVALISALRMGRTVFAFGNGGSAAEASHFTAELVGRFSETRRPFPAVALASDPAVVTCIGNDFGYGAVFERQVEALVRPGDVIFVFTTSGKSENILRGAQAAKRKEAITVALTGASGLKNFAADYLLNVPSTSTSLIQEVHLVCIHVLCVFVDKAFCGLGSGNPSS